jgi:N-acetylglucosaminyldiphosphoundecaprenol N-acetyl-beta-D-mannosaminyltransferase
MKNCYKRVNVLGVGISVTNMEDTLNTIQRWIDQKERRYVCVTGVHGIMECQKDEELRRIHNNSGLTVPDGMPMVWAGLLRGFSDMGRVYGPDLMLKVCNLSEERGYSHFLYGGKEGVAEELKHYLSQWFPGINIVGTYTPPFRPLNDAEEAELTELVARLRPDCFWVGLSTPKQERFMATFLDKLDAKVMFGVGAAFDIHTFKINDAPVWMKKSGLQWFHRLLQEPGRLWRRYVFNNSMFLYRITFQLLGIRKYSITF